MAQDLNLIHVGGLITGAVSVPPISHPRDSSRTLSKTLMTRNCVLPSTVLKVVPENPAFIVTSANSAEKKGMGQKRATLFKGVELNPLVPTNISSCHTVGSNNCVCCPYPSPIKLAALIPLLNVYPLIKAAHTLREGFSKGFRLGFEGHRGPRDADNLLSVQRDPPTVLNKLQKEVNLGRMAGPFVEPPFTDLFISPIGLVPKSDPGKFRLSPPPFLPRR